MNKEALLEALKLIARQLVLAIIPFGVSYFAGLPYAWAVLASSVLIALDKYLHEIWKGDKKISLKGIIPF